MWGYANYARRGERRINILKLEGKLANPIYLKLYQEGLLDPKYLKLSPLEYRSLLYHFQDEPKAYFPDFPFYDKKENGYFIKYLELSNGITLTVKSKDIKKRIHTILRERNILTLKQQAILKYQGNFKNQLYTRNY